MPVFGSFVNVKIFALGQGRNIPEGCDVFFENPQIFPLQYRRLVSLGYTSGHPLQTAGSSSSPCTVVAENLLVTDSSFPGRWFHALPPWSVSIFLKECLRCE